MKKIRTIARKLSKAEISKKKKLYFQKIKKCEAMCRDFREVIGTGTIYVHLSNGGTFEFFDSMQGTDFTIKSAT
ncbi:hypothetical protein [Giesbergeria sp.]|uniref:hypothetical protein n=1 Tax=Giesbergeria sp. TaxID=2818473 RepID=UPI00261EBEFB|nr:hypothetical protein [Giesbergeria sp.]